MANEKQLELINKWDVVNRLIRLENEYNFHKPTWDAETLYRKLCNVEIEIGKAPTVDAVEVVHGRWLEKVGRAKCSVCADECWADSAMEYNYCPNCGAKMDGDGNA